MYLERRMWGTQYIPVYGGIQGHRRVSRLCGGIRICRGRGGIPRKSLEHMDMKTQATVSVFCDCVPAQDTGAWDLESGVSPTLGICSSMNI